MIIRPVCKKEFVALPNSLFNDRRLSADTRAMIALLLSKPRGWELRPIALAKLLSRERGRPVGWTRLSRMFTEAAEAGYMARSREQAHKDDGTWGRYDYFVGMPEDVVRAVQRAGVAIAPHPRDAHEARPRAANDYTNHKKQTSKKTNIKNSNHHLDQRPELGTWLRTNPMVSRRPSFRRTSLRQEVVQHRVAVRLGLGDAAQGWLIFGALSDARRDSLTAMERTGHLNDDEVLAARDSIAVADSSVRRSSP